MPDIALLEYRIRKLDLEKASINDDAADAVSSTYSASKIEQRLQEAGIPDAPADNKQYGRTNHQWKTITDLGVLNTKDSPADDDKPIYRDSADNDKIKTSTWAQIKAFLKTYFDGIYQAVGSYLTSDNISDDVYGSGWNGVTTIAPSKNAVYDKVESLSNLYSGKGTENIFNESGGAVGSHDIEYVFINQSGEDPLTYSIDFEGIGTSICYVRANNIIPGGTVTLNFHNELNGTDPNIELNNGNNGSTFIFVYSPTLGFWYRIL